MTDDVRIAVGVTEHEREMLRAAAKTKYNGSVQELIRDSLRMCGFRIKARADIRPVAGRRTV